MKSKKIYFALIFIFTLFLLSKTSYAGTQKLNSLNYDIIINKDRSASITEIWNIRVSETNTLFKDFEKITGVTEVKVSEILSNGEETVFINNNAWKYHVDKGHYHGAYNGKSRRFEIAWGVAIDGSETHTYKIEYRIKDAVTKYEDCSEFYWQLIGKTNAVPSKIVTGTIKLPKEVQKRENLRVWAHGPLNGNINIVDNGKVAFEVKNLSSNTMLEVRIIVTEDIFKGQAGSAKTPRLESALREETKWANEANSKRRMTTLIITATIIIGVSVGVFFVLKIIKYVKILLNAKKTQPDEKLEYFRDFPDESATAGEAAFLYYFDKASAFKTNISKIVSATMLNLALKGAISFEQEEKDEVYIIINEGNAVNSLKTDEASIYTLLIEVKEYIKRKNKLEDIEKISMKDIEKYAKVHDDTFLKKIDGIEEKAKKGEEEKGNYDKKILEESKKWNAKSGTYISIGVVCLFMITLIVPVIFAIPCFICGIICNRIANKKRNLTPKGVNEQEKWKALKNYMENFSLLNEREVPELVLWEKYLVYATAFGIADKVLEQLKVKYPEFRDDSLMVSSNYTYIYMLNRINMDRMIISGMQNAYHKSQVERASSNYSSGFGRRRRLLWWPEAVGGGRSVGMGGR